MAALLASGSASAYQIFFGEDTGLGEGTPLAAFPIATAARTSFLSNLVGVGTEDFESYAAGTGTPLNITFPGAGTATLGGDGQVANVTPGTTNGVGRYATSGSQYWEASQNFTITFSSPVAAFGFFGIDIGDFNGQVTLQLTTGGTVDLTVPNSTNVPGGGVLFYGIIAQNVGELFTAITFGNTAAGVDFFGFDDMTVGSLQQVRPTPEPATLALLGIALAGMAFARRRQA